MYVIVKKFSENSDEYVRVFEFSNDKELDKFLKTLEVEIFNTGSALDQYEVTTLRDSKVEKITHNVSVKIKTLSGGVDD